MTARPPNPPCIHETVGQVYCTTCYRDVKVPIWLPIASAPKDTAVLVYNLAYTIAHYNTRLDRWSGYFADGREFAPFPPTHWQPLPDPPPAEEPQR